MFLLFALACTSTAPRPPELQSGFHPAPFESIAGEIASQRARPRVYNFWATWCGPCMRELPVLDALAKGREDFDLVLVNVDHPSLHDSKVQSTIDRLGLGVHRNLAVTDNDPAIALSRFEGWPNTVPVTLVVSAAGKRERQFNVAVSETQLTAALDGLARP